MANQKLSSNLGIHKRALERVKLKAISQRAIGRANSKTNRRSRNSKISRELKVKDKRLENKFKRKKRFLMLQGSLSRLKMDQYRFTSVKFA